MELLYQKHARSWLYTKVASWELLARLELFDSFLFSWQWWRTSPSRELPAGAHNFVRDFLHQLNVGDIPNYRLLIDITGALESPSQNVTKYDTQLRT